MSGALVGDWLRYPILLSYLASLGSYEKHKKKMRMELYSLKIKIEN
jgi:hypothetical protein